MMLHYHGGPITPAPALLSLAGKCFCVSHARPEQVKTMHQIGQSVMLDNGAFSKFTKGKKTDWDKYYAWCDQWLQYPTTWAVIPDEIDAGSQLQDALLSEWPHGERGAPVWHMDEPVARILRLLDRYPRVCIGSTGEYWRVLTDAWKARMDEAWTEIAKRHTRIPWLHMLRGMQLSTCDWPFASVDSTDVAQNHHRKHNTARALAERWDAANPIAKYPTRDTQAEMSLVKAA